MGEPIHKAVVTQIEGLGFYGICLYCHDRGYIEKFESDASDWATEHIIRARQGNLEPLGHSMLKRATAAALYKARSQDPRWSDWERELWGMMAEELAEKPDEGQEPLF